ncbi:MAG: polyprenyl synthetase family protein [Candidatus Omnitrophota bacterium]
MELKEIISPIEKELAVVKKRYAAELKAQSEPIKGIGKYISNAHGKFFRPTLVLLSAKVGGNGNLDKVIPVGVSIELIHTATLIHDDIIDEATLRRNRKTTNSKWGNAISVIAGDYLLSKAFNIISKLNEPKILSIFSKTARMMCEGEMTQLSNAYNFEICEDEYLDIIKKKSAYLISDCCAVGGVLGRTSKDKVSWLKAYGLNLGLAFQIVDDCLDLTGNEGRLGKPLWQDMDKGKLTLPIIYLLKNANKKHRRRIVELIALGGNTTHRILKEEALNSGAIVRSKNVALHYIRLAKKKLGGCDRTLKKTFCGIADYVLEREN